VRLRTDDVVADGQHVRRERLTRIDLDEVECGKVRGIDPGGVDQQRPVPPEGGSHAIAPVPPEGGSYTLAPIPPEGGSYTVRVVSAFRRNRRDCALQVKASCHRDGHDVDAVRREDRRKLSRPVGVRAAADADEHLSRCHQHVASVERAGRLDVRQRPVRRQRLRRRFDLAAARRRAGPRDHRDPVEDDRRVFDEHRVGVVGQLGQPLDTALEAPQAGLVRRVLLHRARVVDRLALEMRQLAAIDRRRYGARQREQHRAKL
jgi:hypothetical protein